MSMNIVNAFSAPPAVDKAPAQKPAEASSDSFDKVLHAVAGQQKAESKPPEAQDEQSVQEDAGREAFEAVKDMMSPLQRSLLGRLIPQDAKLGRLLEDLARLLQGNGENAETDAEILNVMESLQQRLRELMEKNGQQVAGEQLLQMLSRNPALLEALGGFDEYETAAQAVEGFTKANPEELLEAIKGSLQNMAKPEVNAGVVPPAPKGDAPLQVVQSETAAQEPKQSEPAKNAAPAPSFENSVRAAKEQMARETTPKPAKPETDIDALQSKVDAGTYLRSTPMAGLSQEVQAPETLQAPPEIPLPNQVETGVKAALQAGQSKLTMKLAPEGLGELTISMVKTAEGTSLSIIAKNPETQKLLASELNQLRETLRPLKVEVDSIITERQYEMLSQQQSFDQQRQNWRGYSAPAYYGDEPLQAGWAAEGLEESFAPPPGMLYQGSATLDTYI